MQEEILKKTESLEDKLARLEIELVVLKNINKLISQEVDDLHQY